MLHKPTGKSEIKRGYEEVQSQIWVAQYLRSLFVMYYGKNYTKDIAMAIQHRYYDVKYQLYDNLPDLLPMFQSNIISFPK